MLIDNYNEICSNKMPMLMRARHAIEYACMYFECESSFFFYFVSIFDMDHVTKYARNLLNVIRTQINIDKNTN